MGQPQRGITLRSGELAKAAKVSADTIRHYERIGILPKAPRSESGYRLYPEDAIERVTIVQRALGIGFTLSELSDIFKSRDHGGTPCQSVFDLTQGKLTKIGSDIVALKRTEKYLKTLLKDWKVRMKKVGKGQKAHLLQSLPDVGKQSATKRSTNFRRTQS
jgi:MerR family mercuric resistance operon transcriptional regulator